MFGRLRRQGAAPLPPPGPGEAGDLAAALEEAIERMPEEVRRCFILCYHRGFSHEEIAELMRLPPPAVRAHLEEARRQLHPWLEGAED